MTGADLPDWAWWAPSPRAGARNLFAVPPGRAVVRVPLALRHARSLHRDERLDEAVPAYRAAIEELRRDNGPDAPMTLGARTGLASALFDVGDLLDASGEALTVLERAEHDLPCDHPIILAADRVHARTMHGFGLYDPAESSLRDLVKACDDRLGPDHRLTLRVRGDLAALRADRDTAGVSAAAEYAQLIDTVTAALGPADEDVLGLRLDAAILAVRRGQATEAIATLERLLAIQTGTLGGSHGQTVRARHRLAGMLLLVGRAAEAELECRDVVRRWRQRHGAADPRTLAAHDLLVRCLCARRAYRLAERDCRTVLAGRTELLGEAHPTTLATRLRLAKILRTLGERAEAGEHAGAIERIARRHVAQADRTTTDAARMPLDLRRTWTPDYAQLLDGVRGIAATRPEPNDF